MKKAIILLMAGIVFLAGCTARKSAAGSAVSDEPSSSAALSETPEKAESPQSETESSLFSVEERSTAPQKTETAEDLSSGEESAAVAAEPEEEEAEEEAPEYEDPESEEREMNEEEQEEETVPESPVSDPEEDPEAPSEEPSEGEGSFAASLQAAQFSDSLIVVAGSGVTARVTYHEKNADGIWEQLLAVDGYVGYNGIGQASEGSLTTPEGVFPAGLAFGVEADPGCPTGYIQLTDSQYWVDDPDSAYYNRFVDTIEVTPDWNSAEHLINAPQAYAYCVEIGYNRACIPGAGSAMFLHCSTGVPTYGCVSVPWDSMVWILQHLRGDTLFVIADEDRLYLY